MTKEELEKEAEEYANNLAFVFETDIVQRIVRERVRLALIDVLEPREKRIAELELKIKHLTENLEPQAMTELFEQVEEEVKQEQRLKELEVQNGKQREQLIKAKELMRTLLLIADNKVSQMEFQLCVADAKQFLSEVEK